MHYGTEQYSTYQYSTVQYSTLHYSTLQYSTVQYSTVQYSTVQYSTVQPCPSPVLGKDGWGQEGGGGGQSHLAAHLSWTGTVMYCNVL